MNTKYDINEWGKVNKPVSLHTYKLNCVGFDLKFLSLDFSM